MIEEIVKQFFDGIEIVPEKTFPKAKVLERLAKKLWTASGGRNFTIKEGMSVRDLMNQFTNKND